MSTDTTKKRTAFLFSYALQVLGLLFVFALLIRIFLISSYVMSGESMAPSLLPGDFILGRKWKTAQIERGDLVVIRCPAQKERVCLRRVVALEGDRVDFHEGVLSLNGSVADQPSAEGSMVAESIMGRTWGVWLAGSNLPGAAAPQSTVVLPQHVFVLNDKRADADDSRQWGPIPIELVEAKVFLIWLSLDWSEDGQILSWPHVRWNRILRSLD